MSEFHIEVDGGKSVRLPTSGKYCNRDILVTATGGYSKTDWLAYARSANTLFAGAIFPEDVDIVIGSQYPGIKITPSLISAFQSTSGVKNLKFDCGYDLQPCSMDSCFRGCSAETLEVPFMETVAMTSYNRCFQEMKNLKEIKTPIHASAAASFNYCFNINSGATNLERIRFVAGSIAKSIPFSFASKLDDVSIQSIIDGLADLTGGTAQTLTFHATVGAKLTDAQKATITAKNWTLAY